MAQQGGHQVNRLDQHMTGHCMEIAAVRNSQLALHGVAPQGAQKYF